MLLYQKKSITVENIIYRNNECYLKKEKMN